jgi:hypothetical protein
MESQYPKPAQVRALRALEVLERMASDEATGLLEELARGAPESSFTRQAKAALERRRNARVTASAERSLEVHWTTLAGDDARRAFASMRALTARPQEAAPFLRERLRGLAASEAFDDSPARIARLIADLDHNKFGVREKAVKQLHALGQRAAPALRKSRDASAGLEVQRRIERLLKDAALPTLSGDWLRAERALEVLEQTATAGGRQALGALARGVRNGSWLHARVTESLRRLGSKPG